MRTYSSSLQEERKGAYRLARFFRLVKNEYIKVFKKLSTKIMIVLIIICALGLSGIALFAKHNMESNNYSSYDATGDYQ